MNFYSLILCLNSNQKIRVITEIDKLTESGRKWFHTLVYEGSASDIPIQSMCDHDPPDIVRIEIIDDTIEIVICE